jgi:hypothetical protein
LYSRVNTALLLFAADADVADGGTSPLPRAALGLLLLRARALLDGFSTRDLDALTARAVADMLPAFRNGTEFETVDLAPLPALLLERSRSAALAGASLARAPWRPRDGSGTAAALTDAVSSSPGDPRDADSRSADSARTLDRRLERDPGRDVTAAGTCVADVAVLLVPLADDTASTNTADMRRVDASPSPSPGTGVDVGVCDAEPSSQRGLGAGAVSAAAHEHVTEFEDCGRGWSTGVEPRGARWRASKVPTLAPTTPVPEPLPAPAPKPALSPASVTAD